MESIRFGRLSVSAAMVEKKDFTAKLSERTENTVKSENAKS
ncbi:MAG: hypothetical protein Q4B90_05195 [Eubacteriales bacterium]|nr:hypothetical protein [Eubacteriales bacterium]